MPLASTYFRRGTRGTQPAATAVKIGTLYYVTDEAVTERSSGSAWETYGDAGASITRTVGAVIGDGTNVITTGAQPGVISCPVAGTLTKVRLLSCDSAVTSGSIVIDVWKDTYANYPPTVADTITASAKPTISSATKSEDSTLTGWTTAVAAGNIFRFNVDSVTSLKMVLIEMTLVES